MAYSTNPHLPKARATAMQLLVRERLPLQTVANRCGVHRSTVWRWKRKWDTLNEHVQLQNDNRPNTPAGVAFRFTSCKWLIPTYSSCPHTSPRAIGEQIVARILEVREQLKRCAEVVWHHLTHRDGIAVSLSSVRRILRRHHCFDGARKKRLRSDNPRRPKVTKPGELVQTDTIHHVDPFSGRRLYYYSIRHNDKEAILKYGHKLPRGIRAKFVNAHIEWTLRRLLTENGGEAHKRYINRIESNVIVKRATVRRKLADAKMT